MPRDEAAGGVSTDRARSAFHRADRSADEKAVAEIIGGGVDCVEKSQLNGANLLRPCDAR